MPAPGSNKPLLSPPPGVWRGGETRPWAQTLPTGLPALDAILPGGGWPVGALTEILPEQTGIGELRLVMPALARLSHQGQALAWVAPPYLPCAPALAAMGLDIGRVLLLRPDSDDDCFWAADQTLRSGSCAAVLVWPHQQTDPRRLRRLQLAAEQGRCWGLLFRPPEAARNASPAAVRLLLRPHARGLELCLLKCRGGRPQAPLYLELPPGPPSDPLS